MARAEVQNLFLRFMGAIYLFAFASLYHQLPGLFGNNGILPASAQLPQYSEKAQITDFESFVNRFVNVKPTLLWLAQAFGIDLQSALDVFALTGIVLASVVIVFRWSRNVFTFGTLWLLYLSLHSVGNTFLWFQWDALLLEAGFLAFVFAPLPLLTNRDLRSRLSSISMWPVRWLFFRLMFMSGVVKLQSQCPTWWKLTALHHHYESQCIPTLFAWYIHQLPGWVDKLTVFHAFFSEIIVPFFFFAPTRGLRKFAFYNQLILQLGIILTGNYNFFNLLSITLSISLLDDEDLGHLKDKSAPRWGRRFASTVFNIVVIGGLLFVSGTLFNIQYDEKEILKFRAGFTEKEFDQAVKEIWPLSVGVAILSLIWNTILYFRDTRLRGILTQIYHSLFFFLHVTLVLGVFTLSLVPYSALSPSVDLGPMGQNLRKIHNNLHELNIVNGYGLFRRMTGVEGRPELILEGSNDKITWKEYEFQYKPGRLDRAPPFIVPHQPRLDWQMWFASLSDRMSNPWVDNLVYRLLKGEKSVLRLLDPTSPFTKSPPKYVRGTLYKYWFTAAQDQTKNWWRRKHDREWMAPVSLNDENFVNSLKGRGITEQKEPKFAKNHKELRGWLRYIREVAESMQAPVFVWSVSMVSVMFSGVLALFGL